MDPDEKAALKTVNRIRKELGLPPRDKLKKGWRSSASFCPISRSIKANAAQHGVRKLDITCSGSLICRHDKAGFDLQVWRTDAGTTRFTANFDQGIAHKHLRLPGSTPNPET